MLTRLETVRNKARRGTSALPREDAQVDASEKEIRLVAKRSTKTPNFVGSCSGDAAVKRDVCDGFGKFWLSAPSASLRQHLTPRIHH